MAINCYLLLRHRSKALMTWVEVAPLVLPLLLLLLLLPLVLVARQRWLPGAFSFDDKVVVITGAGRGIGRQLARRILASANGATLVLLDVDAAVLAGARASLANDEPAEVQRRSNRILLFKCDVSDDR